ncbi:MAG: sugar phosphate isomerase/epimerase family protein [Burkholderiales bacterium]|jgi:L-ribulose-5-phosphate 3-epimerase
MKIGTLADWFGVGLIEGIRESQRCGAHGVQVYAAGELDSMTVTPEQIKKVRDTARECDQQIVALCGELGGFGLEKAEDNAAKIEYLKRTVELALEFDCHVVTTHIGVVPADKSHPRYAVMKEACMEIGEFAAKHGSCIAVETGPELITTLKSFVDDCGEGIAINYDPANIVMATRDDEVKGVYTAGKSIVHTHAKDGICRHNLPAEEFYHMFATYGLEQMREKEYSRETPLGEGSVRWNEYLTALKDIGYNGFLTIEREVKNGAEDIRMAVKFLNAKLKELNIPT